MPHFPFGTRCKYDDQDENFSVSNWSSPESLHSDWLSLSLSLPFWSSASAVEIEINFIRTVLFSVPAPASSCVIECQCPLTPAHCQCSPCVIPQTLTSGSNCVCCPPGALNVKLGWLKTSGQVLLAFYSM